MPPQDPQTLAVTTTTTSDAKITCDQVGDHVEEEQENEDFSYSEQPDFPPESFWLSKDAELDWFDRNAFLDRNASTKANQSQNQYNVSNSNPSSQRFSTTKKSKTSIIGLPKPQQKPCLVDARHRRNQTNSRLFPKRGGDTGSVKPEVTMAEPSSPKVSCMGRVRSRRDRNRRLKNRQRSLKSSSSTDKPTTTERRKKKGIWKNLRSIFRSGSGHKPVAEPDSQAKQAATRTMTASHGHVLSRDVSSAVSPPGLGGMARFSSGRRSDAWVGDVPESRSGPLNGVGPVK